jgi:hypothetical protein
MANYVNPTGTFDTTTGDDAILFNTVPTVLTTAIDALAGNDSLTIQIPYTDPISFDATDNGAGSFTGTTRLGPYDGLILGYNVENVEFDGGRGLARPLEGRVRPQFELRRLLPTD